MEGNWDNFDWDQSLRLEVVFDTSKKMVDDSRALVDRTLVKIEKFRTTFLAQTNYHTKIDLTLSPQTRLSHE